MCSNKAKLENCIMCIKYKRLIHASCLRTKEALPQAFIAALENSRNKLCYACKDCVPYKVYDTLLYSKEQARNVLRIPSAEVDNQMQMVTELSQKLSVLNTQNADLKTELHAYRNLIEQAEKSVRANQEKESTITSLQKDVDDLMRRLAATKNMPVQLEEQRRKIAELTASATTSFGTSEKEELIKQINQINSVNLKLKENPEEAKTAIQRNSITAIKLNKAHARILLWRQL